MSKVRIEDTRHAVYPGGMLITVDARADRWYVVGYVRTRHGVVGIYHQEDLLALTVVEDGAQYERTLRDCGSYTERGIARHAHRFARDVATGESDLQHRRAARRRA